MKSKKTPLDFLIFLNNSQEFYFDEGYADLFQEIFFSRLNFLNEESKKNPLRKKNIDENLIFSRCEYFGKIGDKIMFLIDLYSKKKKTTNSVKNLTLFKNAFKNNPTDFKLFSNVIFKNMKEMPCKKKINEEKGTVFRLIFINLARKWRDLKKDFFNALNEKFRNELKSWHETVFLSLICFEFLKKKSIKNEKNLKLRTESSRKYKNRGSKSKIIKKKYCKKDITFFIINFSMNSLFSENKNFIFLVLRIYLFFQSFDYLEGNFEKILGKKTKIKGNSIFFYEDFSKIRKKFVGNKDFKIYRQSHENLFRYRKIQIFDNINKKINKIYKENF